MPSVLSIARRYSFTAKHISKRPREYNLHVGCFFPHSVYLCRRKATQSNFATTKQYLNTRISLFFFLLLSKVVGQQRVLLPFSKTHFTHTKLLSLLTASFFKYKIMLMKLDGQIMLRMMYNWTSLNNTCCQSIFSKGRERAYQVSTSTHGANYVNIIFNTLICRLFKHIYVRICTAF